MSDLPSERAATLDGAVAGRWSPRRLRQVGRSAVSGRLVKQSAWVAFTQIGLQGLRLATNVVLARLVAPELFGIMLIVNSLRTGIELLSDVGIGQNIVRHHDSETADFLSTALTLQAIRGAVLTVVGVALSFPLALLYGQPVLRPVFIACSCIFAIDGLISPGRFVYQRDQKVRELALFQLMLAGLNAVVHIAVVAMLPTIWGLVIALIVSVTLGALLSWLLKPGVRLRWHIDRRYAREIVSYGKWVFVSSAVFFAAMNFDRLYLGVAIPMAALGVYAVAKSLSEAFAMLVQRAGDTLLFPKVSQAHRRGDFSRDTLRRPRLIALLLVVSGLGTAIAGSDIVVGLLYNARYADAALVLPVLLLGSWFTVLAVFADGVSMGTGRPIVAARANVAKLAWLVTSVPLALGAPTLFPAFVCIATGDFVRYAISCVSARRHRLSFLRQDAVLTALLMVVTIAIRAVLLALGWVDDWVPHPHMRSAF